jgi:hypothetical protein
MEEPWSELWQELPSEILERVLSFLPVPALCRFRAVCKKWNGLVSSPTFAAQSRPQRAYAFVMPDTVTDAEMGWELFDSVDKRYYYLSDGFLLKQVETMDRFQSGFQRSTIAADRGLFCVLWSTMGLEEHALFVCNPVTKQFNELPFYGFFDLDVGAHNPVVLMSVEPDMTSYRIFFLEEVHPTKPTRQRMHVFDSTLKMWLKLPDPPQNLNPSSGVIMDGILYILFWDSSNLRHSLWSFSSTWTLVVEKLLNSRIPQLVVSLGRLFFVRAWAGSFSIVEIELNEKKCITVTHMPSKHFEELVVQTPYIDTWSPYHDRIGRNASFLSIGCGDSIVVSSFRGRSVTYNLVEDSWEHMRVNKQLVQIFDPLDEDTGLYGNSVTLSLSMPLS